MDTRTISANDVVKGLKICTQHGSMCGLDCSGFYMWCADDIKKMEEYKNICPYGQCETGCVITLAKDALALLKEQAQRIETLEQIIAPLEED